MPRTAVKKTGDFQINDTRGGARKGAAPREVHSDDFKARDQKPIADDTPRNDVSRESFDRKQFGRRLRNGTDKDTGLGILLLDGTEVSPEYLEELAFYEDPVTLVLNPSTHKNAADIFENWSNGVGAEMLINGKWVIVQNLPVGKPITVKRKIAEQIVRARVTEVRTANEEPPVPSPRNQILRSSSQVHSFSILRDPSPKAAEWLEMIYARPI